MAVSVGTRLASRMRGRIQPDQPWPLLLLIRSACQRLTKCVGRALIAAEMIVFC